LRESVEGLLCGVLRLDPVEPKRASSINVHRVLNTLNTLKVYGSDSIEEVPHTI